MVVVVVEEHVSLQEQAGSGISCLTMLPQHSSNISH
jgi:hypothetical protein